MSIIEKRINPLEIDRLAEVIEQIGAGLFPRLTLSFPHHNIKG